MKKVLCLLCLSLALVMSGCSSEEEVVKSEIEIKENDVYSAPSKPTDEQVELFNSLTAALKKSDEEKVVSLVAQNFAFDFFSLKNKESSQDVGGLTYLPEAQRDEFKTLAMAYVYSNYSVIKNDLGTKQLLMVNAITVNGVDSAVLKYSTIIPADANTGVAEQRIENDYDGWLVSMSLEYDKTDASDLKEEVTVMVIDLDGRICVIGIE